MELRSGLRFSIDAPPPPPVGGADTVMALVVDIPPSPPTRGGVLALRRSLFPPSSYGGASRWIPTPTSAPTSLRTRLFPLLRSWGVGFLLPSFPLALRRSLFPPSSYGGASRWIPTPTSAPTSLWTRLFPLLRSWGVGFLLPPFPLGLRRSLFPPSSYGCCPFGDHLPPLGSSTTPPLTPSMGVLWPRHPPSFPTKVIRSFTTLAPTSRRIVAQWACRP